ncbi:MAG: hypothetical protein M3N13_00770, partial [Candidatus Eremiobacteraeota bacterium]|nr:hypothetical protein [Candidatus Eremiobacteraeota bacterium]
MNQEKPLPRGVPDSWGERHVRGVLQALKRPHLLGTEPLALFLCESFGRDDPYEAVLALIQRTFSDRGHIGKRLYDVIYRCDIDASNKRLASASEMNVSLRQFFRYRHEAIRALTAQANALAKTTPSGESALEHLAGMLAETDPGAASQMYALRTAPPAAFARVNATLSSGDPIDERLLQGCSRNERLVALIRAARYCAVSGAPTKADRLLASVRASMFDIMIDDRESLRFEIALTHYVRALVSGTVDECAEAVSEAAALAKGNDDHIVSALIIDTETAIRRGDLAVASQSLGAVERIVLSRRHLRNTGIVLCCEAAMAFMRSEFEAARDAILAARLALPNRPFDAMTIHAITGRIHTMMGLPWRAPGELLLTRNHTAGPIALREGDEVTLDGTRERSYQRLYLSLVDVRARFASGEIPPMEEIAHLADVVRSSGYRTLATMAQALIGRWYESRGRDAEAEASYLVAWESMLVVGDYFVAFDAFENTVQLLGGIGPVGLGDAFFDVFTRRFGRHFRSSVQEWRRMICSAQSDR